MSAAKPVDEVLAAARALAAAVEDTVDALVRDPLATLQAEPTGPLAPLLRALKLKHVASALQRLAADGKLQDPPQLGQLVARLPSGDAVVFRVPVRDPSSPVESDTIAEADSLSLAEPAKSVEG